MNTRNLIRKSFSLTVNQLVHFVFVLTMFAAAIGMFAAREAQGATFTVTNSSDDRCFPAACPGTLRRAINDANDTPGADTIVFAIPGSGVKTIVLVDPLFSGDSPLRISDPVFIDGWSQGDEGYTGPPLIEITPSSPSSGTGPGLIIDTNNSTVRGLILNRFTTVLSTPPFPIVRGDGIRIDGNNNTIQGCYIGTTPNGQAASSNQGDGIFIVGSDNIIGGITAGARNVISGNGASSDDRGGIRIQGHDNTVQGNYIGVSADGFTGQGNSHYGIFIIFGNGNQIGGLPFGDITRGNVISGNGLDGIKIGDNSVGGFGNGNIIQGNNIGVAANGSTAVGNNGRGIYIEKGSDNKIGGTGAILELLGAGNTIRNNISQGVRLGLGAGTGNRVS
ncbi:MAG: hypothetical protein ND866_00455, partial [Pyrinomonadaceae bacterium]|nr:hypothetical protein [Pyrinomonadaceae bacterium]